MYNTQDLIRIIQQAEELADDSKRPQSLKKSLPKHFDDKIFISHFVRLAGDLYDNGKLQEAEQLYHLAESFGWEGI